MQGTKTPGNSRAYSRDWGHGCIFWGHICRRKGHFLGLHSQKQMSFLAISNENIF